MLQLIKLESGAEVITQSHKNKLTMESFNNFRRMAERERLGLTPLDGRQPEQIDDFYNIGMAKLKKEHRQNGLDRFRPYSKGIMSLYDEEVDPQAQLPGQVTIQLDHQDVSDSSSDEM
jgi:hypothetical protein